MISPHRLTWGGGSKIRKVRVVRAWRCGHCREPLHLLCSEEWGNLFRLTTLGEEDLCLHLQTVRSATSKCLLLTLRVRPTSTSGSLAGASEYAAMAAPPLMTQSAKLAARGYSGGRPPRSPVFCFTSWLTAWARQ